MNILELDSYRLSDAVKFNDQLNPRLWDDRERMRPEVREQLLKIADDFAQSLGVTDLQLKDVTVSGSNAAYTYTPHSDIDLHLVVDLPEADASDVYRELFDAKKYQYNDQHNITIGGYDVELYVQNANQPHISQGIYSVLNDQWIQVPSRKKPTVDDISARSKYETLKQHIDQAIHSQDYERISAMADKIKKMRQAGLEQHGEFGPENLAFKMLRTQGLIEKLYTARNAAKDQSLSLDERKKKKKPKKRFSYGAFGGYWYPGTSYAGQDHPAGAEGGGGDGGGESIRENQESVTDEQILQNFVKFVINELNIEHMPRVKLRRDPEWPKRNKTFGRYIDDTKTLEVAWGNRHVMDVLRTVAHELTHKRQHEREDVPMDAGETGSKYENEANARAGILMRDWARLHPEHFDHGQMQDLEEGASGYIPTKAQAKDPRYSMALTVDIKPGQVGKEANKLKLKTNRQGQPQVAQANGLFEQLMLEYQQIKEQDLDEVRMSPSALSKFADSEEAQGIRAGFEAELIFRDASGDDEDEDIEPDYDMDERAYSVQQVIEFFQNDDYGYGLSDRQTRSLENELDETYMNWRDERINEDFENEAEDLVREVWLEERPMNERILSALVDGIGLDDAEADKILIIGDKAPRFTKNSDQEAYKEANPGYDQYLEAVDIADEVLDEEVEASIANQDGYYDQALDAFRDNYDADDSNFFSDVGLRWMSDIASNFNLDWPYMTGGGSSNYGSRDWDEIGASLRNATGIPVKVSSGYHSQKRGDYYVIEPDGSLDPDDKSQEVGLEIVSPPMPLNQAIEQLQRVIEWANDPEQGNAYTNSSTGLHMGVSIPYKGGDVDYLKLILFMGDKYVLNKFGRAANTYTASAMEKLRQNVSGSRNRGDDKIASALELMKGNLLELAQKYVQQGVGSSKYTSAHIKDGYIEFRSPGGDYLAKADEEIGVLEDTMRRFAYAMYLAGRPDLERPEYYKKLYKLIAPEGNKDLELFSKFSTGEITAEQLKKQWAEKTIGTEKKMNQRWKLYQNVDGRWEPVPAAEWNGYTEDQVKNAVWSKYGREALESGEYKLVNMSEDQQWEVYDVKTGQTLEIVKGRNKGEVADAVYDKYVDQGIGFNVRPYVDPTTLTPRAKLAKRIVEPKVPKQQAADNRQDSENLQRNLGVRDIDITIDQDTDQYEIVDRRTNRVMLQYRADDAADAGDKFNNWLRNQGMPADTENYGYRPLPAVFENISASQASGHYNILNRKKSVSEITKVTPVAPVRQDATRTKYNQVPRKDDPAPNPAAVIKISPEKFLRKSK